MHWLQTLHNPAVSAFDVCFMLFLHSLYKRNSNSRLVRDIGCRKPASASRISSKKTYSTGLTVHELHHYCFSFVPVQTTLYCFQNPTTYVKSLVTNLMLTECRLLWSHLWRNVRIMRGKYALFRDEFRASYIPRNKACHITTWGYAT